MSLSQYTKLLLSSSLKLLLLLLLYILLKIVSDQLQSFSKYFISATKILKSIIQRKLLI
jgi:hypothetical protein